MTRLNELKIVVKGAGEMASGVAWRLSMANFRRILMLEKDSPAAVRRAVSFCEAVHEKEKEVENVRAVKAENHDEIERCWDRNAIAVMVDPHWQTLKAILPMVTVDAVLAKKKPGYPDERGAPCDWIGPWFLCRQGCASGDRDPSRA